MSENETHTTDGKSPDLWEEIHDLATRSAFDVVADTDVARFGELLRTSKEARQIYVEHVLETVALASLLQPAADNDEVTVTIDTGIAADRNSDACQSADGKPGRSTVLRSMADALQLLQGRAALSACIAAVVTIAALGVSGLLQIPGDRATDTAMVPRAATVDEELPAGRPLVATITGVVDCRWATDLQAPTYGDPILAGRIIDLKEGLAQLSFESGAKMILQGPASFTVDSEMGGTLDRGKLSALVPKRATGFMIRTPSAEVIDLGTEFGVEVGEGGKTEIHVLQGEVVSWAIGIQGEVEGDGIRITENGSITIEQGGTDPVKGDADETQFVREIVPRLSSEELPALPIQDDLVLWLAADVLVTTDADDRVIAWQDILVGDNQSEESAWQHEIANRPVLVDDAIGGNPALRFDGQASFLVTTPMATTDDQTIFIVFQRNAEPKDPRRFRQLINYNGPPFRVPDYGLGPGVLQIGDGTEPRQSVPQPGSYRAMVHAGVTVERIVNTGYVRSRRIEVGTPVVLTYLYNRSKNCAELLINGESQGESTAPTSIAMNSRKALGRHPQQPGFFDGDMAEVLIYNDGFERAEIDRVIRYLMRKYGLQSDNTE